MGCILPFWEVKRHFNHGNFEIKKGGDLATSDVGCVCRGNASKGGKGGVIVLYLDELSAASDAANQIVANT
jgi:hypothetical protein